MPYTIYADTVNDYTTISQEWSVLRDGDFSVVDTINTSPTNVTHQIQENSTKYVFTRTYMDFDLSSVVDPITSIDLYLYGNVVTGATSYDLSYTINGGAPTTITGVTATTYLVSGLNVNDVVDICLLYTSDAADE